jgi:hypothetical protein
VGAPETLSLCISIISLLVAIFAARYSYQLGARQVHLAARHDFLKQLLEVDKELIRDPSLWALYDNHPMAKLRTGDPAHEGRLEAFAYLKFNIYNMVFVYAREMSASSLADRELFECYDHLFRDSLTTSALMRNILKGKDFESLFGKEFTDHLRGMLPPDSPNA